MNVEVALRRYERELAANRERKRRYRGTCRECGGETRYNGHGKQVSDICASCNNQPRSHCIRGHALTPGNRLKVGNEKGGFTCRICRNAYMREYLKRRYATDPAVREKKRQANARRYLKQAAADRSSEAVQANKGKVTSDSP